MALVVNTNVASITSQMYVNQTNKDMADTMARLSSGKRINTAADDAAGVAIASRLSSEIRGTNQAIRNAQDGQALIDTAEGAHLEIENILQRMRELAVQSANDTNNFTDRSNLDAELQQLVTEIDRTAGVTSWAGINLLDGSSASFDFQIGGKTSAQDVLSVSINSVTASSLGVSGTGGTVPSALSALGSDTSLVTSVSGDTLTITTAAAGQAAVSAQSASTAYSEEQSLAVTVTNDEFYILSDGAGNEISRYQADGSATIAEIAAGLSGGTDASGDTVTVSVDSAGTGLVLKWSGNNNEGLASLETSDGIIANVGASTSEVVSLTTTGSPAYSSTATDGYELYVTDSAGTSTLLTAASGSAYATLDALVDAFQLDANYASALYTIEASATGIDITFNDTNGPSSATLTLGTPGLAAHGAGTTTTTSAAAVQDGQAAQAAVSAQNAVAIENITITVGSDQFDVELDTSAFSSEEAQAAQIAALLNGDSSFSSKYSASAVGAHVSFSGPASSFSIATSAGATSAITAIDNAISTVNTQRANLGAYSNRLDHTVNNLSNIAINLEDGRSRIQDADFAQESANLAKQQIMLQAGTAMLAQANASQQNVLSLLG